jgi:hypothetical protein
MNVPILNPRRPSKKWFYRAVASIQRSQGRDEKSAAQLAGWIWYHGMSPRRKHEILAAEGKTNPAVALTKQEITKARGLGRSHINRKGLSMRGRRRRRNRTRVVRSRRTRAPISAHVITLRRHNAGKRRKSSGHIVRPRIIQVGPHSFRRTAHSRTFSAPTMINPRRRRSRGRRHNPRRSHRRSYRRNPFNLKGTFQRLTNKRWLISLAMVGGGIAAGMGVKTILLNLLPMLKLGNQTKLVGIGNIVVGSLMIGLMKQRVAKQLGGVIAATGAYDLLAQNVKQLQLSELPVWPLVAKIGAPKMTASGSYPVPVLPVSPVAALAGGYTSPAAAGYHGSYLAPDMKTQGFAGDDSPYANLSIDW